MKKKPTTPPNLILLATTMFLAFILSLYIFTPVFDEWVIGKSLNRYCSNLKEEFSGQFYSPAYLCTFIEGAE